MSKLVGIEITRTGMSLAVSDSSRPGAEVEFLQRELESADQLEIAYALKEMVAAHKLQGASAFLAVHSDEAFARVIEFPFAPPKKTDMRQIIGTELETKLPLDLEDIVFSYEKLPSVWAVPEGEPAPVENTSAYLTAAMPLERGRELIEAATDAGLSVKSLFAMPAAAASLVRELAAVDQRIELAETIAHVSVGTKITEVCIIHHGRAVYSRSVQRGIGDLVSMIKRSWRFDDVQAYQTVAQCGFRVDDHPADDLNQKYFQLTNSEIFAWVRDLGRAIRTSQQTAGFTPKLIVTTGPGGNLPGLGELLQSRVGVQTLTASELALPELMGTHDVSASTRGALAAAAIWEGGQRKRALDLRVGELSTGGDFSHLMRPAARVAFAIGLVMMFALLSSMASLYSVRQENAALKTRVELESTALYQEPYSAGAVLAAADSAEDGEEPPDVLPAMSAYDLLIEINKKVPSRKDVTLETDKLTIDDTGVVIDLRAKSSEEIATIEEAIGAIDCLKKGKSGDERVVADEMIKVKLNYESNCWRKR